MTAPPRVLAIAGSDSSGGAGIQADIKTITMLGGYAMTAITAVTAQNSVGVQAIEVLSPELVGAQIDACLSDIGVDAIKIGMLGSAELAHSVADRLEQLALPMVFDPVMVATSGAELADDETVAAFGRLTKLATLTTPNTPELAVLSGIQIEPGEWDQRDAAEIVMQRFGAHAILAKGGHRPGGILIEQNSEEAWQHSTDDLLFDCLYTMSPEGYWNEWEFPHARLGTLHTHGTGCTLSSAIALGLGSGLPLDRAVKAAIDFVQRALKAAPGFGAGHGPMGHHAVR